MRGLIGITDEQRIVHKNENTKTLLPGNEQFILKPNTLLMLPIKAGIHNRCVKTNEVAGFD